MTVINSLPRPTAALRLTLQIRVYIKKCRIDGQRIGRPILITENNLREFLNHLN